MNHQVFTNIVKDHSTLNFFYSVEYQMIPFHMNALYLNAQFFSVFAPVYSIFGGL